MDRKHLVALGGILVALIALLVFLWRPTRVVNSAVTALSKTEAATFTAILELQNAAATQQILGESGAVELKLAGAFTRPDDTRPALKADVVLTTKTESVTVNVEGEVRFFGDKAYVFVKTAPPIFGLLTQIKGRWLELPRGEENAPVAPDETQDPLTNVKRAGTDAINGKSVVKYEAVATSGAVVNMMDSVAELLGTRLTADQVANIRQSVTNVGTVPVEVWVDRWSSDVRQLRSTLDIPGGNQVRFTLVVHDVNAHVVIEAPAGAVNIEQAVKAAAPATPQPRR